MIRNYTPQRWPYAVNDGQFDDVDQRRAEKARKARNEMIECFTLLTENATFMRAIAVGNAVQIGLMLSEARNEWIANEAREAAADARDAQDQQQQARGTP